MATTATTTTTSDSIHKQITLRATPARVWRALSDAREFSVWFGAEMRGEFVPGQMARGAAKFKGQELPFEILIERLEPERLMAFRWHPFAIDPSVDYSHEPMTLVEIRLEPAPEGTQLTITESGFDQIPAARRARAFEMNTGGWAQQAENIARHVHA